MEVRLKDADKLMRLFNKLQGDPMADYLTQAVFMTANSVLNDSKKLVPVDQGVLRDSGRVEPPKVSAQSVSVEITYGGAAAPYALIVHEDMRPKNWSKPGTGPKYLERPVLAWQQKFVRAVLQRYASYIQGS